MDDKSRLENLIAGYVQYLESDEYMTDLFGLTDGAKLIETLAQFLSEHRHVGDACSLIRDLVTLKFKSMESKKFKDLFPSSIILPQLERLLIEGNFDERRQVIYTLGKTFAKNSLPKLISAFNFWRDSDPLILPRLFFEIKWLSADADLSLIPPLVESPNYIVRWSAVKILGDFAAIDSTAKTACEHLRTLEADPYPLVSADARYELEHSFKISVKNNSSATHPNSRISFDDLECWFGNHMYESQKASYTMVELEAFIANKVPILVLQRKEYRTKTSK